MAQLNVKLLALLLVTLATVISAKTHNVTVGSGGELSFSPNEVKVKVGDKADSTGTITITKDTPKKLGFFCDVSTHCKDDGMMGVIIVKE
ncbi:16998_t:CDS:2 [Racocetra fulgida]|uniref:16998_t:CDS:1 n=1 Tax=Racocetra fulgida TaxID=60492 RepID=A0A9N8WDY8_9GLOM|nr:16998_t:CDS:2 [Racocetra fulgida]